MSRVEWFHRSQRFQDAKVQGLKDFMGFKGPKSSKVSEGVPGIVFSINLVHLNEATNRLGFGSRGGPAHHLTGVLMIN